MILRIKPTNPVIILSPYASTGTKVKKVMSENSLRNLSKSKFTGEMSAKTRSNIIKISYIMVRKWQVKMINYRKNPRGFKPSFNFITLTIPSTQIHTDQEFKRKIFNVWLSKLRVLYPDFEYIWRCEKQLNGNIHFHIICNKYIPKAKVRYSWNSLLSKHGYTYKGCLMNVKHQAPSTKIESIKTKNGCASYISKYISKNVDTQKVYGMFWSSSISLGSAVDFCVNCTSQDFNDTLFLLESNCFKGYLNEYVLSLYVDSLEFLFNYSPSLISSYFSHIQSIGSP